MMTRLTPGEIIQGTLVRLGCSESSADALDRPPQLAAAPATAKLNKCPVLVSKLSLRPLVGSSFQRESSQTVLKEPIARDENSGCRFATCFTRPIRRLLRKIPIRPITLSQPTQ